MGFDCKPTARQSRDQSSEVGQHVGWCPKGVAPNRRMPRNVPEHSQGNADRTKDQDITIGRQYRSRPCGSFRERWSNGRGRIHLLARAYITPPLIGKWINIHEFLDRTVSSAILTAEDALRTDRSQL